MLLQHGGGIGIVRAVGKRLVDEDIDAHILSV
jgi:hypothetical protein